MDITKTLHKKTSDDDLDNSDKVCDNGRGVKQTGGAAVDKESSIFLIGIK